MTDDVFAEYVEKMSTIETPAMTIALNDAPSIMAQMMSVSLEDPDASQKIREADSDGNEDFQEAASRVLLVVAVLLVETQYDSDAVVLEFLNVLERSPQVRSDWKTVLKNWMDEGYGWGNRN